uniref:GAK system XXXCH domain-containing protein n=1 Tax=Desulfobacca acetoxidans TaxID=60893 RepID=A0A7V4LDS8_9BACT
MEEKEEKSWPRLNLAQELENLARGLREGSLTAAGGIWTVPPEVAGKLEIREKKGRLVVKAKFSFETLGQYAPAAREPVAGWQEAFKAVKQRLGRRFREMQQAVLKGDFPPRATLEAFSADSQAMARLAEPDWQEAMTAYLAHVEALHRAVKAGDLEALGHEMEDLRTAMVTCHREFK